MLTTALDRSNGARAHRVAHRRDAPGRRPRWDETLTVDGATVVVVGAGYPGKRRIYVRLAELGARLVILDEPGHWSEALVDEGRRRAVARGAGHGRHRQRRRRRSLDALAARGRPARTAF